jgi:hypothetical protein
MTINSVLAHLPGTQAHELRHAQTIAVDQLLNRVRPLRNVVGVATGVKWTRGQPTGRSALLVLVTHKLDSSDLERADLVPESIAGTLTDVVAVGRVQAAGASSSAAEHALVRRQRPVKGGFSVGHPAVTAGTIALAVYDVLPGGALSPPAPGIGIPSGYYILSNNHILANENSATIGDPILQPGSYDGGKLEADVIGSLTRYVPIELAPDIPKEQHANLVDAAIALVPCQDIERELYWIGRVRGWRRRQDVTVGTVVQKVGRSSGYTIGRIIAVNATIDIGYSGGKTARFHDQFLVSPCSFPGDSGSLITTLDGVAVGLLCAGSPAAVVINQIENVRTELGVEIAEQIL